VENNCSEEIKMKIGFTGTREGMTDAQKECLSKGLAVGDHFHHGACIGADAEAHTIAKDLGLYIVVHLPLSDKKMIECIGDECRIPTDYLTRDHNIVDETEILYACPKGKKELLRSGTWATIRYAVKTKKIVMIFYPDGTVEAR